MPSSPGGQHPENSVQGYGGARTVYPGPRAESTRRTPARTVPPRPRCNTATVSPVLCAPANPSRSARARDLRAGPCARETKRNTCRRGLAASTRSHVDPRWLWRRVLQSSVRPRTASPDDSRPCAFRSSVMRDGSGDVCADAGCPHGHSHTFHDSLPLGAQTDSRSCGALCNTFGVSLRKCRTK